MNIRLIISASIVSAQSLVLWGIAGFSMWSIFRGETFSLTSALFLFGLVFAAALWSSNIAKGLFQKRTWAHTPAMILQLLVASIGTASFAGEFGSALIGSLLLLPAATAFYFLFSGAVRKEFGKD